MKQTNGHPERDQAMTPDFKSILVPVDFSSTSSRALEYAHALATRFGASLHVIHVCEVPALTTGSMDAYARALLLFAERVAQTLREIVAANGLRRAPGVWGRA